MSSSLKIKILVQGGKIRCIQRDMLTSCARNILQAREIQNGLPVFQVGPTIYRGLWVVDGHFMLEAAQYLGYRAEAFKGVDTLLKRVDADGSIAIFKFGNIS